MNRLESPQPNITPPESRADDVVEQDIRDTAQLMVRDEQGLLNGEESRALKRHLMSRGHYRDRINAVAETLRNDENTHQEAA